ncbi:MAG: glycoside hydrolase family 2 protein, partial [Promicromonosporaceae bacterium]|nr:glycoside hydrolase family 2 protein [Promicromonosporaceae bacterium]
DWGIDVAGAGIWKPIGIDSWSGVRIGAVRPLVSVRSENGTDTGLLQVAVDIERAGRNDQTPVEVTVSATPPSSGMARLVPVSAVIPAGETSVVVELTVPNVELWWPLGHGEQPLYGVEVAAAAGAASSGIPATWKGRVGFRTVRVDTSADAGGAGFTVYVNEKPVNIRGANWIPDHAFLTKVTRERYARGMADAIEAGLNLLRVWGGGIYESDDLYDLADECGMLMWQDFLFACAAYSESPAMAAEVDAEVRDNITRLSPHPSLIIWNGNNENTWGSVDWGWAGRLGGRPWGDHYYSKLFPEVLGELDPTRFYSPASPYSFGDYRHPNDERYGTSHQWEVWNREDYSKYREHRPRFVSEFGFQGPPAWSTLTRVVHDEPLDPFGHEMLVHQKANLGNKKLERGWQGHLPDPANIEDWHWTTQLNQAAAIRFGVEHYRSLAPLNTGTILWQLNDNWPVVSWAAVDHDGHRKPLWYALRQAYAPRLATIQPRPSQAALENAWEGVRPADDAVALVLLNDTDAEFSGSFTATREKFDGTVLATTKLAATVPARGNITLELPASVVGFTDPSSEVVVVRPDDAASGFAPAFWDGAAVVGQKLDPNPLDVRAEKVTGGVDLTITAKSYARDVFAAVDRVDPNASVDNGMVTLTAGKSVVFHVTTDWNGAPDAFAATVRTANDLLKGKTGG